MAVAVLLLMTAAPGVTIAQEAVPGRGESARLVSDFQSRAAKYLALRKKVAGKSSKQSDSPASITSHQKELSEKIRQARTGAKQGEIFTPELAAYFRRQIAASLSGPHGSQIRASMRHAEPVELKLQVNEAYPDNVPLQSTPPSLLLDLPLTPEGLEYRIIGQDLVMRDTEANIVVDFIDRAIR